MKKLSVFAVSPFLRLAFRPPPRLAGAAAGIAPGWRQPARPCTAPLRPGTKLVGHGAFVIRHRLAP